MHLSVRRQPVARCDHRRWLANVGAAATADAIGVRRERLRSGSASDDHAHLRAYLDRWRAEAGEFFDHADAA
jgi:hypothetical protein